MKGSDRLNFRLMWMMKGCQQALLSTILLLVGATAQAQITPDGTLGGERSQVVPRALGGVSIEGGAIRGSNLFHSFSEFNIGNQQSVYFANPTGIQNILTRVTGNTLSNINGTLGIDGAANLFLLNPNGILFGQNARLDVRGSFLGTTANAIGFGNQGEFSAINPQAPSPLLTVQPSALLFTQLRAKPIVANKAFFEIDPGQRLMLVGGDLQLQQSAIEAISGKIDLVAISGIGTIELSANKPLSILDNLFRANVLINNSSIAATGGIGGDITIDARDIDIANSFITTGIAPRLPSINLKPGNINLTATGAIQIRGNSRIGNIVFTNGQGSSGNIDINARSLVLTNGASIVNSVSGTGNSGNIIINAQDHVVLDKNALIRNTIAERGNGNAGDIQISTKDFLMSNNAVLIAGVTGQGNAGNIKIAAVDNIALSSGAKVWGLVEGVSDIGGIYIDAKSLFLSDDASIQLRNFGQGNTGDILINARDQVSINGAGILSNITSGNGGNVHIKTGSLTMNSREIPVLQGAFLLASTGIFSETLGQSKAGDILIEARDQVVLDQSVGIASRTTRSGNSGKIQIKAASLSITNLATVSTITSAAGDSGDIEVDVRDHTLIQGSSDSLNNRSAIQTRVLSTGKARAGNIELKTGTLEMRDRGQIRSDTEGQGNAGDIKVNVRSSATFDDASIINRVSNGGVGNSGTIELIATTLSLLNGAQLDSSTFSQGNSGDIVLKVHDSILIDGFVNDKTTPEGARSSTVFTEVYDGARGNGGDINIETRSLIITNGGQIDAKVRGTGNSGDIKIVAQDQLVLDGERADGTLGSRIITSLNVADVVGKSGNIEINTGSLSVTKGAQILTNTLGRGNAGNVTIKADRVVIDGFRRDPEGQKLSRPNTIFIFPSAIFSNVARTGVGNGGNIEMTANTLSITNAGLITVGTAGRGNAGSIQVNAQSVFMDSSIISANSSSAQGEAGDIRVEASTLRLRDRSAILSETVSGRGGNIDLTIDEALILRQQSRISTTAGLEGSGGDGGNIRIQAESGFIIAPFQENSDISANAFTGIGGTVRINSQGIFGIQPRSQPSEKSDITASSQSGVQGQVSIAQPEVQPTQGVLELPTEVLDASNQMGQVCPRNSNVAKMGKFVVSGTGSLPPNPLEPLTGSTAIPLATIDGSPTTTIATLPTSNEPSIVEAQGWIRENGTVKLVAAATPNSPSTPAVCPIPQAN